MTVLAGMSQHRSTHSQLNSPVSPPTSKSTQNSSSDPRNRRAPSSSERFKAAENLFLSGGSTIATTSPNSTNPKITPKRRGLPMTNSTLLAEQEELDRFIEQMKPLDTSTSSNHLDEKQASSTSFPPLSPLSPLSPTTVPSPPARGHDRRPSFMQATRQELQRQSELREIQAIRETRRTEEVAKSTRRAHGKTNTDLYQAQQMDLEAKRLAIIEKEEQERKDQRAKLLAKLQSQDQRTNSSTTSAATNTSHDQSSGGSSTARAPKQFHIIHTSHGSQTSRTPASTTSSSNSHVNSNQTAALLQHELQMRQEKILQDSQRAASHTVADDPLASDEDEGADKDFDPDDDDSSSEDLDEETKKNTIANTSKAKFNVTSPPSKTFSILNSSSITSPNSHTASEPVTLTAGPDDSVTATPHELDLAKRTVPTTVAQIYDPNLGRLLSRHEGTSSNTHHTGLDFLMESMKVKKAIKNKKAKQVQANIHTGFGRMTEAQIERSLENIEKKKALEQTVKHAPMHHANHSTSQHHHTNSTATSGGSSGDPGATSPAKESKKGFLPNLWKRITGS